MKIENHFFKDIELVYKNYLIIKEKEEKFNIFSVLYKEHDEKNLHSRFISALLDPFGSHKLSYKFLKEFINLFDDLNFENFNKSVVYPEEWNKKENQNIDILIIDRKSRNAIIIENKIYAEDSNNDESGQLERYFKYVRDIEKIPQKNIKTIYLTLDRHDPTDESLGEFIELKNINGICISHPVEIVNWLNNCLKLVVDKPFIREAIIQYIKLINKMTQNDTEIQERLELKEKIGESEINMKSTKYLIDNFKHVKWHTVYEFWIELSQKLKNNGFTILSEPTEDDILNVTHYETYRKGQKDKQNFGLTFTKNNEILLSIWNETDEWLYWGVSDSKQTSDKYRKIFADGLNNGIFEYSEQNNWWKYLFDNDEKRIWLSNFSNNGTFNLINKDYRTKIISEIVNEILTFTN